MEAILRQAQQPGYACIIVTNCPSLPPDIRCSIQRSSDGQYLSKEGLWGNTIETIVPENPYWDSETLTFFLPLHVVSDIDSLDGYALYVNDLDRCILDVPEELNVLNASPTGCVSGVPEPEPVNTAGLPSQPMPQPMPQTVPQPAPQPVPQPAPEPAQFPGNQAMPPEAGTGEEAKTEAFAPEEEASLSLSGQPEAQPGKKKNMVAVIAAIAVILLLACGAGLYFSGVFDSTEAPAPAEENADKDKAEEKADTAQEEAAKPAAEQPAEAPAAPAEAPQAEAPAQPLGQARSLLRDKAGSGALLDAAKPMLSHEATEESRDAAFLLIEQAAQNGDNPEAMYLLGQLYDPSATLPRGTVQPDLVQAHDWYKNARDKGYGDADAALARLKEAVEQKAGTGDREARALLQRW